MLPALLVATLLAAAPGPSPLVTVQEPAWSQPGPYRQPVGLGPILLPSGEPLYPGEPPLASFLPREIGLERAIPPPRKESRYVLELYDRPAFQGAMIALNSSAHTLVSLGFNDATTSLRVIVGARVRFYEDENFKGEYFTYNCPRPIGNVDQGFYCDVPSLIEQVSTGWLCVFRPGARACKGWWNHRISSVEILGPADEHQPQGVVESGRR